MKADNFGKNLQAILDCLELTQGDFAKRTGLTAAAVSMLCSGEREPMLKTILKIMESLGCSLERLCK
jgi:transcriptional regulator with XRE-family HTH domain